jgi:hypothetical protein
MDTDGTYTAIVDRIEDGPDGEALAVLLLEVDGDPFDQLVVPVGDLPAPARAVDAVVEAILEDGELADATHRSDESRERVDRAQSRFDRLSRRPPSEDADSGDSDDDPGDADEDDEA